MVAVIAAVIALGASAVALAMLRDGGGADPGGDGPAVAEARAPHGPGEAVVAAGARRVRAHASSYCLVRRDGEGGGCVDTTGVTADSERLPARAGETLTIELGADARRVAAWLSEFNPDRAREQQVSPRVRATRVGSPRRWRLRMPKPGDAADHVLRLLVVHSGYRGEPVEFGVLVEPR